MYISKNELERLRHIETAYIEMLNLWQVPNTNFRDMLDTCDDDLLSGNRIFPLYRNARIKDVRRWLDANSLYPVKEKND